MDWIQRHRLKTNEEVAAYLVVVMLGQDLENPDLEAQDEDPDLPVAESAPVLYREAVVVVVDEDVEVEAVVEYVAALAVLLLDDDEAEAKTESAVQVEQEELSVQDRHPLLDVEIRNPRRIKIRTKNEIRTKSEIVLRKAKKME